MGKTWVSAALLRALLSAGVPVAARKPVESHQPGEESTDAGLLAGATGEAPGEVCPPHRRYQVAMAPPMAAEVLGRPPFTLADLVGELRWPPGVGVGLVETAGGVRSPLACDADSADLARAVAPDMVVLVADAGLGAINAVRLAAAPLADLDTVVFLSRYDPACELHRRNRGWLEADGFEVVVGVEELVERVVGPARTGGATPPVAGPR